MRRVFGKGRTGAALGVGAAVTAAVAGATLLSPGSAAPKATGVGGGLDRVALTRLLHQETFGPGLRVPGSVTRTPPGAARASGVVQESFYNWAGFADQNQTYTKVAGAWTQPAVTCVPNEDETVVFWIGLDGFNDSTVEQAGTLAQCVAGQASYYTWWEMYPTNDIQVVGSTVKPGDQIKASVNFASSKYNIAVTDSTTTANSFTRSESCGLGVTCSNSSAEWIVETPSYNPRGFSPWPAYGTWKVTNATVTSGSTNGVINSFPDVKISIIGERGENLATTGILNPTGDGFNANWKYAW